MRVWGGGHGGPALLRLYLCLSLYHYCSGLGTLPHTDAIGVLGILLVASLDKEMRLSGRLGPFRCWKKWDNLVK